MTALAAFTDSITFIAWRLKVVIFSDAPSCFDHLKTLDGLMSSSLETIVNCSLNDHQ